MSNRRLFPLLVLFLLVLPFFSGTTALASMPAINRFKEGVAAVQGVWYDLDGNETFSAEGDSFDGRKILDVTGYGGSAEAANVDFFLEGKDGEKPFYVNITWTRDRRFLLVNGRFYRNTKEPDYFESARGVFLGMKKEDMLTLLGEPTKNIGNWRFVYPDMTINTSGGMVVTIFLPQDGARLDGSGLGADDAPEDFAEAYGFSEGWDGQSHREIGDSGEYLQRKEGWMILSLFGK